MVKKKDYYKDRYNLLKKKVFDHLGNKCVTCGSTLKLEVDHIDHKNKNFTIFSSTWDRPWEETKEELNKCQLLCKNCHLRKTVKDRNYVFVKDTDIHGTLSSYRYCKCDQCRKAKSDWMKEYAASGKRKS